MAGSDQWKKTYELNEEAWRKWYREQNRARKNRPLPLLLFVFSTVIQFPLILLYVVRMQMRAGEAAVLLLLSASLGLLACFNRYASKTYAHFRLKQPDPSRQYGTCRIRIQKENVWICKPGKTCFHVSYIPYFPAFCHIHKLLKSWTIRCFDSFHQNNMHFLCKFI